MIRRSLLILLLPVVLCVMARSAKSEDLVLLFSQGKVKEAQVAGAAALESARASGDQLVEWHALINLAWLYDEIGRHRDAIELSNQALVLARRSHAAGIIGNLWALATGSPMPMTHDRIFLEGRSLSWLGWAYSSIGRYDAAAEFYKQAVALAGPDDRIQNVQVWGLSTQELGNLRFKQGHLDEGAALVEKALAVARQYGVEIGIAECTSILAEIELQRGSAVKALRYADEAVQNSSGTYTSIFGVANARYVRARAAVEIALADPAKREMAQSLVAEAADYASTHEVTKIVAATKMLQSRLLAPEETEQRIHLLQDAYAILTKSESELRGLASVDVGSALNNREEPELARFYVEQGLRLTDTMLRHVDKAHSLAQLSEIELTDGSMKARMESLQKSMDAGLASGDLRTATSSGVTLTKELYRTGYLKLARQTAQSTLGPLNTLLEQEITAEQNNALLADKRDVTEILVETALRLNTSAEKP